MGSHGTLPTVDADEALAALFVAHGLVEADLVDDVRAALDAEPGSLRLIPALLDAGVLPQETAELFVDELERGILTCPGCGGRFNTGKIAAGTRFKCKTCSSALTVPPVRITRAVLAADAVTIEDAMEVDAGDGDVAAADDLSEDALDAVLAGGTAEGQLLDFTDADVEQESIDGPQPKRKPKRARGDRPKRSSRRTAAESDDLEDDYDDEAGDGEEEEKDAFFVQRLLIFVVGPIILMILGIYFTPDIKRAMMGSTANDDPFEVSPGHGRRSNRPHAPTVPAGETTDWEVAEAAAKAAMELVQKGRTALAAGNNAQAIEHFDAADGKFQEAYDAYAELESIYEGHLDDVSDTVAEWVQAQEKAAADRAKAQGK